jgi:hypothetical protein
MHLKFLTSKIAMNRKLVEGLKLKVSVLSLTDDTYLELLLEALLSLEFNLGLLELVEEYRSTLIFLSLTPFPH